MSVHHAALSVPEVLDRARTLDLDPEPGSAADPQKMWTQDHERRGWVYRGLKLSLQ